MNVTRPVLYMAAYAIIFILILVLGLGVLNSKSAVNEKAGIIDAAAQMAQENKSALDNIDSAVESKIALATRSMDAKLTSLRTQNLRMQQQLAELEKKLSDSGGESGDLKWIMNPATRHRYCVMPYPLPWHYAKRYAEKNGGRLVMINDEAENEWLVKTFGGDTEYWIGLTDEAEEGKWLFVDGSLPKYFNWAKPEPDNYRKNQHYGIINSKAPHLNQTEAGQWNDVPGNEIRVGIIEQQSLIRGGTTRTRILP